MTTSEQGTTMPTEKLPTTGTFATLSMKAQKVEALGKVGQMKQDF